MAETYVEYSINRKLCEQIMLAFLLRAFACVINVSVLVEYFVFSNLLLFCLGWYLNVIRAVFLEEQIGV